MILKDWFLTSHFYCEAMNSLDSQHHRRFLNLHVAPCFSWWFVSGFVLWIEREDPLTHCVGDIKEINYTAYGYYLHRIKLLGLGNISSVKNPMWTRDTAPQLNKWWNFKINVLFILCLWKAGQHISKKFSHEAPETLSSFLSLTNWIVNYSYLRSFMSGLDVT